MSEPRLMPIPPEQWTDEQRACCQPILDFTGAYNMLGTFLHHWDAFKARANAPTPESTLEHRLRELVILRVAYVLPCEYEWAQHKPQARRVGVTDEEIERIKEGAKAAGWTEKESALLAMADDLIKTMGISDEVWNRLINIYDVKQIIDAIHLISTYMMVAMVANSFKVQIEKGAGFSGFDASHQF